MVFDEKAQEWKPRYGYKRVNDPKEDWVLEVPQNAGQLNCDWICEKGSSTHIRFYVCKRL